MTQFGTTDTDSTNIVKIIPVGNKIMFMYIKNCSLCLTV